MKIGIVGLPNVGKSTLFQALTKKEVDRSNYPFATIDPNIGVVEVPDERLSILAKLSKSKKTIPAIIEFVDIAGLVKGANTGEGLGNKFLSHIKETDAIVEVVRAFEDPGVTHVEGGPDPKRDIEILETELALKDLDTAEKALERLGKESKTGVSAGGKNIISKLYSLKNIIENLKTSTPLTRPDELELAGELGLLKNKPILYCFNTHDGKNIPHLKSQINLNLKEEFEISELAQI